MTMNEGGSLEDGKSNPQPPLVKKSLSLFEKQQQITPAGAHAETTPSKQNEFYIQA